MGTYARKRRTNTTSPQLLATTAPPRRKERRPRLPDHRPSSSVRADSKPCLPPPPPRPTPLFPQNQPPHPSPLGSKQAPSVQAAQAGSERRSDWLLTAELLCSAQRDGGSVGVWGEKAAFSSHLGGHGGIWVAARLSPCPRMGSCWFLRLWTPPIGPRRGRGAPGGGGETAQRLFPACHPAQPRPLSSSASAFSFSF